MGGLQDMQQNQDMSLVLSTDAKPRLKWTPELHQRFVDAVNHLGGPEKATPKSLMRMMGIPGLTLYHLKSHLQKYRLGKNHQQPETSCESKQDVVAECKDNNLNGLSLCSSESVTINDTTEDDDIKENVRIAQAIQMQMEVQKKLHEQIEVQRHLQLRIEAQGKYLQKVLKKAQETLSGYNCCSPAGVEHAKAELSQLVSMVTSSSSSFSELTEITTDLSLDNNNNVDIIDQPNKHLIRGMGCSVESSLTSSESSEEREKFSSEIGPLLTLPLLDRSETRGLGSRKRSRNSSISCDQRAIKRGTQQAFKLDLNTQCESEFDLGSKQPTTIDLNSKLKE